MPERKPSRSRVRKFNEAKSAQVDITRARVNKQIKEAEAAKDTEYLKNRIEKKRLITREGIIEALEQRAFGIDERREAGEDVSGEASIAKSVFENMGSGTQMPSEAAVRWLADHLECTAAEKLRLLQAAGYASMMAPAKADIPKDVEDHLVWHLHVSPWPGYIMNQVWDVVAANAAFARMMGVSDDYLESGIEPEKRNSLLLIFDEGHPFRHRLTASQGAWREIAETNIRMFKIHNAEAAGEEWFTDRLNELLEMNEELREMWLAVDPLKPFVPKYGIGDDGDNLPMAFYVPFNTQGHPIKEADPAVIELLPSSYLIGKGSYPCVFTYVPRNAAAIQWFQDIGIMPELALPEHSPDNGVAR